jgi:hypothetical protein
MAPRIMRSSAERELLTKRIMNAIRLPLVGVVVGSVLSACSAGGLNADGTGAAGAAGMAMGAAGNGAGAGGSAAGMGGTTTGCAPGGTGGISAGTGGQGLGPSDPPCPGGGLPDCVGGGPVCGDGKIDACLVAVQSGFCQKAVAGQACDGADFGQETCQSQGFGSGALACSTSCTLDSSGCRECTADASLIRCGEAPVATPGIMAMGSRRRTPRWLWPGRSNRTADHPRCGSRACRRAST